MHSCNAHAAVCEWRARDAMWPAYSMPYFLRKPWLVDPPPAQRMRAQLSNYTIYAVVVVVAVAVAVLHLDYYS